MSHIATTVPGCPVSRRRRITVLTCRSRRCPAALKGRFFADRCSKSAKKKGRKNPCALKRPLSPQSISTAHSAVQAPTHLQSKLVGGNTRARVSDLRLRTRTPPKWQRLASTKKLEKSPFRSDE